ncbi:sensor histidine kinase [[Clostridium] polysaccharolyticum]|uniref:histidine kinase n=1 Tax=[Clostridium] polysaccharolyticum TaxID=29364 RepID=A0A1I0BEG5_9FIRM|nr:HAMP domain-containing sensor histidine kinase [[Clostridium] polysaccharolyticum]SET04587.1 Signal transduction histidine kinase [[Clostridium] polysaccharolyticum]
MKKRIKEVKNSVRLKLTLMLAGFVLLIVFLLWLMNLTFYPLYYKRDLTNKFYDSYNKVKEYYAHTYTGFNGNYILQNDYEQEVMSALAENKQMNIYVFGVSYYGDKMYPVMFYPNDATHGSRQLVAERFGEIYGTEKNKNYKVIVSEDNCLIFQKRDGHTNSDYLELMAPLDKQNGIFIFTRSNLESMSQNIRNTNKFLALIGIITGIAGVILMYFFSRKFTTPILRLADISKRMSELDFTAKYDVKSQDEIGELGTSINALSDQLEHTISELKTANNELRMDNERKTQIDDMRKEFLSNVSHELKTPIALIQGYAEGLKENITDDQESRDFYCEVIMDEAQKMNKMVKKLLTLNQIEFGNNVLQIERFDISQMMASVLNSTHILFEQKKVQLQYDYQEPVYVWSDEYMVEEVFTNFISNALNHVAGEKVIRVHLEERGDNLRVSVFNTGNPIPEAELEKIWIKFYKVDKARTREYGGNGIGLSIVSAIMKALNQNYGVYNTENGVCFWFDVDKKNR